MREAELLANSLRARQFARILPVWVVVASKGAIAVYPVAGWWKNRRGYDQSDLGVVYSLVVSIESPEVEVDLWTPVAQQIAAEVAIET